MKHKHQGMSERSYSSKVVEHGFHGSPMESHETHGGKAGAPKELTATSMPGRMAMGVKPEMARSQFEGGEKTSGKSPKKMSVYSEE